MRDSSTEKLDDTVVTFNPTGASPVVLVCEHASPSIPGQFDLGLDTAAADSHAAWDPGALAVAEAMSDCLDAVLIASAVSRLVYDCNRPPDAGDAMPVQSERFHVPGNVGLTSQQKAARVSSVYEPFRQQVARVLRGVVTPILVTVHSFTPVYAGQQRTVEIGVLHDRDKRLADAMLDTAELHTPAVVCRNQPYGPEHGVTHTLKEHALPENHLNVMLELRNDLIDTAASQRAMAEVLAGWVADACTRLRADRGVTCSV